MAIRPPCLFTALCLSSFIGLANPKAAWSQAKALPDARITGSVQGVRSGTLMVSDATQSFYVQPAQNAKVDILGAADPSILQAGMHVRFDIKMDKQGNGKEDVAKIELFTFDPVVARMGIEDQGDDKYLVAGQIKSVTKAGKLTVGVPGAKIAIKAQLGKDAALDVGVRGAQWLSLAKMGDGAVVHGKVARPSLPNAPGLILADEIQVTLNKQAVFDKEKPAPKTKTTKPKEKSAEKKTP